MTKKEDERLAVVETKIDNIQNEICQIKKITEGIEVFCTKLSVIEVRVDKIEKKQDSFINKNGFITTSILLGVLLTIFTILQWIKL